MCALFQLFAAGCCWLVINTVIGCRYCVHQTYDYLTSCRLSPLPFDWYIIILLSDRGICVWTTCLESLHESGMAEIPRPLDRKSNALTQARHTYHPSTIYTSQFILISKKSQNLCVYCKKCDHFAYSYCSFVNSRVSKALSGVCLSACLSAW